MFVVRILYAIDPVARYKEFVTHNTANNKFLSPLLVDRLCLLSCETLHNNLKPPHILKNIVDVVKASTQIKQHILLNCDIYACISHFNDRSKHQPAVTTFPHAFVSILVRQNTEVRKCYLLTHLYRGESLSPTGIINNDNGIGKAELKELWLKTESKCNVPLHHSNSQTNCHLQLYACL